MIESLLFLFDHEVATVDHRFPSRSSWLLYETHSYSQSINVIRIVSIPYLPRIRSKIHFLFLFLIPYLIESILFLILPQYGIRNQLPANRHNANRHSVNADSPNADSLNAESPNDDSTNVDSPNADMPNVESPNAHSAIRHVAYRFARQPIKPYLRQNPIQSDHLTTRQSTSSTRRQVQKHMKSKRENRRSRS